MNGGGASKAAARRELLNTWLKSVVLHLIVGIGGCAFMAPLCLLDEYLGPGQPSALTFWLLLQLAGCAICGYAASIVSQMLLQKLSILTWQVANVSKRLVLIVGVSVGWKVVWGGACTQSETTQREVGD